METDRADTAAPDRDCYTLPNGSCVAPNCWLHGPLPPINYEQVARIYRWALSEMRAPVQAVAEILEIPWTTATGRVRDARRKGFLEPADRRVRMAARRSWW